MEMWPLMLAACALITVLSRPVRTRKTPGLAGALAPPQPCQRVCLRRVSTHPQEYTLHNPLKDLVGHCTWPFQIFPIL